MLIIELLGYLIVFVVGMIFGSFFNVIIYRLPKHLSIVLGRSKCPSCQNKIKSYDLIPVMSYLFLKGKCRHCGTKISIRYPIIELLTGVLWGFTFYQFGFQIISIFYCIFASLLLILMFIDIDCMILPDSLILLIMINAIIIAFLQPEISLFNRSLGFLSVSGMMLVVSLIKNGGFGGGDIKLMMACGFLLGLKLVIMAFVFAIIIGGMQAIYLLFIKKQKDIYMPFGPALCISCYFSVFYGEVILQWYLGLL